MHFVVVGNLQLLIDEWEFVVIISLDSRLSGLNVIEGSHFSPEMAIKLNLSGQHEEHLSYFWCLSLRSADDLRKRGTSHHWNLKLMDTI